MEQILFSHSSFDGHLSCFYTLAALNMVYKYLLEFGLVMILIYSLRQLCTQGNIHKKD